MISLIAILTMNHVIGKNNTIPWHIDIDMKWFFSHTVNKPIVMGRKTFESMGKRRLLKRLNIVLSRDYISEKNPDVFIINNISEISYLLQYAHEIMVVGGGMIYDLFLPQAQRLYLTYLDIFDESGDVWFPEYDVKDWKSIFNLFCRSHVNCRYSLNFKILERI